MSDHPLNQLSLHSPGSGSANSSVRIKKRDKVREFWGISKSQPKEVNIITPNTSLHHSTNPPSVASQVSSNPLGGNQSVPSSTMQQDRALLSPLNHAEILAGIFPESRPKPSIKTELPRPLQRIEKTEQLVYCNTLLLQDSLSSQSTVACQEGAKGVAVVLQERSLDKTELDWLEEVKKDPMEADRLRWLTTRMVEQFVADANKDSTKIVEIVSLGPVLQREPYRKLLSTFIKECDDARILDVDMLQGLVQLVQDASTRFLVSDDLVKILSILRVRLEGTHQQSAQHSYHVTLAVSRVLDVMAEHNVQDLDRVLEHEPLSAVLSGLKGSSDSYLMYQACYAFQALQYVSDNESALQALLRHSTGVVDGVVKLTAAFKFDVASVLEGLGNLQESLGSMAAIAGTVYEGALSLTESGQGVLESLKEGRGTGQKRPWYPTVKAAYAIAQAGQLKDLKRLIFEAPCRRDPLFQWVICQLLGEIAIDPVWTGATRQHGVLLLAHLYKDDQDWGRDESVRVWMLTIFTQLVATNDQAVNATASALLQDLKKDQSVSLQHYYPLRSRLSMPDSSPLLAKIQDIPYLEYDLHKLRLQRLEESKLRIYIPPMAKASLQARDDDLFLLMDKVQEFLASDKQVRLILGDSGSGKSTFNTHLESELLSTYIRGGPIPLFVNLPTIDRPDQDVIAKQLTTYNVSDDQIFELKQHRQFVLICDGYDESHQLVNLHKTNMLNQPGQWNTKMVITCRSQYLGQDYRSRFMPQNDDHYARPRPDLFQEAVIVPFSAEQIKSYIDQYVPLDPRTWATEDYMDMLTAIPNLMDLVKNPFLLTLALETLPDVIKGKQDLSTIKITRVKLYDTFVDHWISVNKHRLEGMTLSAEDRKILDQLLDTGFVLMGIDYSTRLALAIFEKQGGNPVVQYVHLRDKSTWRSEFFGQDSETRLLRDSVPLSRSGRLFRFIHRSVQEYFYSRTVFDPTSHDDYGDRAPHSDYDVTVVQPLDTNGPLFKHNLLIEQPVIQFLSERVKQYPDFEKQLLVVVEQSKTDASAATAAANAITILVQAGVRFNSVDLRGIRIPRADLSDGQFDFAQFQGADLRGVNLARSWLRQAIFDDALMDGVQFGELPFLKEEQGIDSCAYSPNGEIMAVGLRNGDMGIYDTATWKKIPCFKRRRQGVWKIAFSLINHHIVSVGSFNTLLVWDIASGETVKEMQGHGVQVTSVAFSPCGKQVASSSEDKTIRLWNSQTGEEMFVLKGHTRKVTAVRYAPSGRRIASCSWDGSVRFWNPETGKSEFVGETSYGLISCLEYSPDGQRAASGHSTGRIQLWDANSGDLGITIRNSPRSINCVAFSPDGQWIISSGEDRVIHLCDSSTGLLMSSFPGHAYYVLSCAFSPNGLQIASRDNSGVVRLWDMNSRTMTLDPKERSSGVLTVVYSPNGRTILSCSGGPSIQRWSTPIGTSEPNAINSSEIIKTFALSPNGLQIATNVQENIQLWDCQTDSIERTLIGLSREVSIMAYSPCGRWIVSASWDKTVYLWDLHGPNDEGLLVYESPSDRFTYTAMKGFVTFSPVGHQFVVKTHYDQVGLFDPRYTNPCNPVKTVSLPSPISSLVYSPDGQRLAFGSTGSSVYVWYLQSEEEAIVELKGHTPGEYIGEMHSVAFSPCNKWLIAGGADATIRLWRLQGKVNNSKPSVTFIYGCSVSISSLAWNPVVPNEFVSGSEDGSVRVWRISNQDKDGQVESAAVRMLWGNNVGRLCTIGLTFKGAVGLSPISEKLLVQRGAIDDSKSSE
ncbi:hypothetical protein BG015_002614 [Linnemannia schmuckeri]|uniref:WD40 repeat-like protein n=1 Tax=Linnemannia schmuckeri TaxID=64567 RepID=A0A9P5VDL7_9FUNG|nr:hypothetical protein BG015_002614 [Linnemannia schmuckeri]